MKVLITGGCGFLGSNIAATLLGRGADVTVLDDLSRAGSDINLKWLHSLGAVRFIQGDTRNQRLVDEVVQTTAPNAIFHLAGQVAMTTSLADPRRDFEVNVGGSINILEAVRRLAPNAIVVYSSSNKVYGDLAGLRVAEGPLRYSLVDYPAGLDETAPLSFETPYGCSKGAADQYMLDYARMYGLKTVVFRHSTIYGGRQFSTYDQGWVGWFCQKASDIAHNSSLEPFTISGDGKQVRDLLFVDDAVGCYLAAVDNIDQARGNAFNIGGGMENSCSLLELFQALEEKLRIRMNFRRLPWRSGDQKFFVANISKAAALLRWRPTVTKARGVSLTLDWVQHAAKHFQT